MIEYYAVVVLYNKKIYDSITIRHLLKLEMDNLNIIVLDNSSEKYVQENETYYSHKKLEYYRKCRTI